MHCIQKWVVVVREGIETHMFKYIEGKEEVGEVVVKSGARATPIH